MAHFNQHVFKHCNSEEVEELAATAEDENKDTLIAQLKSVSISTSAASTPQLPQWPEVWLLPLLLPLGRWVLSIPPCCLESPMIRARARARVEINQNVNNEDGNGNSSETMDDKQEKHGT